MDQLKLLALQEKHWNWEER